MAETITPEQRALAIIPPNYRAETAQTGVMPSMNMVLSSRCAGGLRDAIASAIRAAETAAVEAERARCVKEIEAVVRGEGPLWQRPVADPRGDREPDSADVLDRLPEYIRTPTTEADNHG